MTDRHAEGIEKAAEAVAEESGDLYWCTRVWEAWGYGTMSADDFTPISDEPDIQGNLARALVTAYLDHVHPVVDSVEGLDALPVGTVVLDADAVVWEQVHGGDHWMHPGSDMYRPHESIALPARVIHYGEQSERR